MSPRQNDRVCNESARLTRLDYEVRDRSFARQQHGALAVEINGRCFTRDGLPDQLIRVRLERCYIDGDDVENTHQQPRRGAIRIVVTIHALMRELSRI
ncbi:MAG: hypothetical protein EXS31_12460 [Pedosphaera sp.]|nr:hypothetical protein [Pedosphaera sp.]